MSYDATLPADHSKIVAAELRGQLNALKDLNDTEAGQIADLYNTCGQLVTAPAMDQAILAGSAGNCDAVTLLNLVVSSPPTQGEMQAIANKLDELIRSLQRT